MAITADMITNVSRFYVALFGRAPDGAPLAAPSQDGLSYWTQELGNGISLPTVANQMFATVEARAYYPGYYTNEQIANSFYINVLGRTPDAAGLAYWTAALNTAPNVGTVLYQMVVATTSYVAGSNPDPAVDAAALSAQALFNNRVTVAEYYGTHGGNIAGATAALAGVTSDPATVVTAEYAIDHPVVPGVTFTLTTSVDNFTGGTGNDTFNAIGTTLTGLDSLDGGAGTNTINLVDAAGALINTSLASTVKNIQTANFTSITGLGNAGTADVSGWTGLTKANFTLNAIGAAQSIVAAPTTAVVVNEAQVAAWSTTVTGGSSVTVTNTFGASATALDNSGSTITVNGTTTTGTGALTSVTVTQTDASSGGTGKTAKVVIADPATTDALATVSITGGSSGTAATITSDALTTLNLTNTSDGATVTAAAATRVLALNLTKVTGTVTDATATTVNVTNNTTASTITLAAAAAKSVSIAGDKALTLTSLNAAADTSLAVSASALTTISAFGTTNKLATVTVTGAGGLTADLSGQGTQLTSIDASGSTGANTIAINGTEAYKGGSGVDTVTSAVAPTLAVDGGAGASDVFVVNGASFSLTKVTGFETLGAGALATGAYSAAGFANVTEGAVTGAITWNTAAAGTGMTITAAPGFATTYNLATDTATDALNLTLTSAAAIAANTVTATLVETVNITVTDTNTTKHQDTLTLASGTANAMSIKVTGNAGLALTDTTDVNITSVDASGLTNTAGTAGTGFTWTSGILNKAAVAVMGSAAGGDNLDLSAATQKVTVTEYAGTNTVVGSATKANAITGGTGADTITTGSAADTIIGGGGADKITAGAGADKITITGTTATIYQKALMDSGANTSTTIQTSELTSTFDVIYGATAGTQIDLTAVVAAGSTTNLAAANLAGLDDTIMFARGTYDAAAGTFSYSAAGADTTVTYDTTTGGGTAFETIILVGYVTGATTGTGLLGLA